MSAGRYNRSKTPVDDKYSHMSDRRIRALTNLETLHGIEDLEGMREYLRDLDRRRQRIHDTLAKTALDDFLSSYPPDGSLTRQYLELLGHSRLVQLYSAKSTAAGRPLDEFQLKTIGKNPNQKLRDMIHSLDAQYPSAEAIDIRPYLIGDATFSAPDRDHSSYNELKAEFVELYKQLTPANKELVRTRSGITTDSPEGLDRGLDFLDDLLAEQRGDKKDDDLDDFLNSLA